MTTPAKPTDPIAIGEAGRATVATLLQIPFHLKQKTPSESLEGVIEMDSALDATENLVFAAAAANANLVIHPVEFCPCLPGQPEFKAGEEFLEEVLGGAPMIAEVQAIFKVALDTLKPLFERQAVKDTVEVVAKQLMQRWPVSRETVLGVFPQNDWESSAKLARECFQTVDNQRPI